MSARLRILTFTTLFPSAMRPAHGIFVRNRLRQLLASGQVEAKVVAPVPWFPSRHKAFGEYARWARTAPSEWHDDLEVLHPRYLLFPKIGMLSAPLLLALSARAAVGRLLRAGFNFDLIDAHYYYPDGVAAALLGKWFMRPVIVTARGTDINLIPRYDAPRRMILWAARRAAASVAVCAALRDEMIRLGVAPESVTVLRNGVDLALFAPSDRETTRAQLGWNGTVLLSVGLLIERKGHDLVIDALSLLPKDFNLVIVGEGPMRESLQRRAVEQGMARRVKFLNAVQQPELVRLYGAADALVLASDREGMANVLLEALACGTPVVATRLWGTPEVIASRDAGVLVDERSAASLAKACTDLFAQRPNRTSTRRYAEQFSWDATTAGQLSLFDRVLAAAR